MFDSYTQIFTSALLVGIGWSLAQLIHNFVVTFINIGMEAIARKRYDRFVKKMKATEDTPKQFAPNFRED